jgi:hypothetical protein
MTTQSYYVPGLTRSHGDSGGVTNMDIGIDDQSLASSLGTVISTGVGKEIGAFKILVKNNSGTAVDLHGTMTTDLYTNTVLVTGNSIASQMQTGGVVEAILKVLSQKVTILAYQVNNDATGQISVIFEQTAAWAANPTGTDATPTGPLNDYGSIVPSLEVAIRTIGGVTIGAANSVGYLNTDISGTTVFNAGTSTANNGGFGNSIQLA